MSTRPRAIRTTATARSVARLDERVCTAWSEYLAMTRAPAQTRTRRRSRSPGGGYAAASRELAGERRRADFELDRAARRVARHPPRRVTRLRALSIENVEQLEPRSARRRIPPRLRPRAR